MKNIVCNYVLLRTGKYVNNYKTLANLTNHDQMTFIPLKKINQFCHRQENRSENNMNGDIIYVDLLLVIRINGN